MNRNYLIPANSKKSEMILSMFTWLDLGIFAAGVVITFLLIIVVQRLEINSFLVILLTLLPALLGAFLVFPIPNYHNMLQLLINIYTFLFVRQRTYKWKGWCYKNGSNK